MKQYHVAVVLTVFSDGSKRWTINIAPGQFSQSCAKITAKEAKKTIKEMEFKKTSQVDYEGGSRTIYS